MIKTSGCNKISSAVWLLRVALAFALVYAAMAAFITPANWIGYLPQFVTVVVPAEIALIVWSASELIVAAWIMSGWRTALPAGITAAGLFLMVVFNWGQISILFRDISLGLAAISLLLLELRPQAGSSASSHNIVSEKSADN